LIGTYSFEPISNRYWDHGIVDPVKEISSLERFSLCVILSVHTAVDMKIMLFWDLMCSLVDTYQWYGGTNCLYLIDKSSRRRQYHPLKCW